MMHCRVVNLKPLKRFASDGLPRGSHLRELILLEPDELPVEEFLSRLGTWLRLQRLEAGAR